MSYIKDEHEWLDNRYEPIDLELRIIAETEKAFLLSGNSGEPFKVWLAKSQMEIEEIVDGSKGVRLISFTIPRWLAEKENLI